jgi:hypothetical protein
MSILLIIAIVLLVMFMMGYKIEFKKTDDTQKK